MPEGDENICKMSSKYHFVNDYLYKPINEEEDGGTLQYSDRYYPEGYHAGANMELDGNVSPQVQQRKHNAQHKRPSSGTNQQRRRPAEYFEDPAEEAEEEEPNKFSFQQAPASPRRSQQKSQQLSSQQEFLRASQSRTKAGPSPVSDAAAAPEDTADEDRYEDEEEDPEGATGDEAAQDQEAPQARSQSSPSQPDHAAFMSPDEINVDLAQRRPLGYADQQQHDGEPGDHQ
ncbi:unnamed protein product [Notodromas monacha]|uniref:Uncharacterized protein n=1 Tax=Notodromas monacha TaxID=399045 RepID=A0A7R9C2Z8_9CRUS|nr:unnamed protein product [Notodromas monacha]CAG0924828.1 unnamed protein product [Notodromas monacha]